MFDVSILLVPPSSDGDTQTVHGVDHVGVGRGCRVVVGVVGQPVVERAWSQGEASRPACSERKTWRGES